MKKSFLTTDQADDSPKWQKVTISDECDEEKDGCKYCIEISYAKDTSIPDKQSAIRNLIHIINIEHLPLNFKVVSSCLETVKIVGNLMEIISNLGANRYIRNSILSQIEIDFEIKKVLQESSNYILPPDIDPSKMQLREPTKEDLEDFGIYSTPSTPSTPTTPTKKIGFFESGNNSQSDSSASTSNSGATTPEKTVSTTAEETSKLPPASPTTIKVK